MGRDVHRHSLYGDLYSGREKVNSVWQLGVPSITSRTHARFTLYPAHHAN